MSFPLDQMREFAERGPMCRVVVAETRGSVPREVGASMLVWDEGVQGTIGGGALEYEAIQRAREVLALGEDRVDRCPLGPSLGQCCGGSVTVLSEIWDAARLASVSGGVVARPLPSHGTEVPLAVDRILADARGQGARPEPGLVSGWMVEPVSRIEREIWVWGAGHVGRAVVDAIAPLPGIAVRWADCDEGRFPEGSSAGVERLIAANPADLVSLSGPSSEHLVLTYSHALDLELCHRILGRPFRFLGLIGSATKWARFRSRLCDLGHAEAQVARIVCPIGDPALGKHPQEIALGVATDIVAEGKRGMDMVRSRTGARA